MTQLTRQQLYDKIRKTSKDAYTLSEMTRLGYWSDKQPKVSNDIIKRKTELQTEINQLSREIRDPQAALKAIHKQRMADARQKRIDTKINNDIKRYEKAVAWHEKKQTEISYLGDNVSFDKKQKQEKSNNEKLAKADLPITSTGMELAKKMGVSLNELRFLSYSNKVSKVSHYQRFEIAKKTGGYRLISAPMPRLKRLQYWVLDNILLKQDLSKQAHGFVQNKSIVTNAEPHIGQAIVINMDLKNFFPTISYPRIRGLFAGMGYNHETATLLALLCSEPETQEVELDQQRYFISHAKRYLPQGAPTSPAISNLICRKLDKRLQGLASKFDFVYTRYADDLTFSSSSKTSVKELLHWVTDIVHKEGFIIHPDKTRVMHKSSCQEVTGIVVNEKLSVNRKTLKQFRALLYQIKKDGYEGKQWGKGGDLLSTIQGYAFYVRMVAPEKGDKFLESIREIKNLHGKSSAAKTHKSSTQHFRQQSSQGKKPLEKMKQAKPAKLPDISEIIHHHDVLDEVREALGMEVIEETSGKTNKAIHETSSSWGEPNNDTQYEATKKPGLFAKIGRFFGGGRS